MYRHCIYCQGDLGANEIVEQLPIGRRIAFDPANARLWVVCGKCERWNLTPFDDRWQAIEECERQFRGTKLRVSTDNIGLARLREGLELVRIGDPLRPEMAAWRYGDQFGRRRRRYMLISAAAVSGGIGLQVVGGAMLGGAGGLYFLWRGVYTNVMDRVGRIRIPAEDGRLVTVVPSKAKKARIGVDLITNRLTFTVKSGKQIEMWHDDAARAAAAMVLPRANIAGASKVDVQDAVSMVADADPSSGDDPLRAVLGRSRIESGRVLHLDKLGKPVRLALEMALHEEQERRALLSELGELELRWREAEEIAAIADSLTVPESIEARFAALKRSVKDGAE